MAENLAKWTACLTKLDRVAIVYAVRKYGRLAQYENYAGAAAVFDTNDAHATAAEARHLFILLPRKFIIDVLERLEPGHATGEKLKREPPASSSSP